MRAVTADPALEFRDALAPRNGGAEEFIGHGKGPERMAWTVSRNAAGNKCVTQLRWPQGEVDQLNARQPELRN